MMPSLAGYALLHAEHDKALDWSAEVSARGKRALQDGHEMFSGKRMLTLPRFGTARQRGSRMIFWCAALRFTAVFPIGAVIVNSARNGLGAWR
jgi:hypothetical protein